MTELVMQADFWREVSVTVAARLSVVAVALWGVKMMTDYLRGTERSTGKKAAPAATPAAAPGIPVYALNTGGSRSSGTKSAGQADQPQPDAAESWKKKMGKYLSGE